MAEFDYICMTLQGELLRGEHEAADKNELAMTLWSHKLFLVWWREKGAAGGEAIDAIMAEQIAREGQENYQTMQLPPAPAGSASSPAQADSGALNEGPWTQPFPISSILKWVANHSAGAVTNPQQALLVLSLAGCFLASAIYIASHGMRIGFTRAGPLTFEAVNQPAMSAAKVNNQRRRTKKYLLQKVRASVVKKALDHVMSGSSLTTELVPQSENILVAKAAPLDLELVDQMIPIVDKDYGKLAEDQMLMPMVNLLNMTRGKWMAQTHAEPEPTPEERRLDQEEQMSYPGRIP